MAKRAKKASANGKSANAGAEASTGKYCSTCKKTLYVTLAVFQPHVTECRKKEQEERDRARAREAATAANPTRGN